MKKHVCKKIAALLLSALLLVTLFAGCSNGSSDGSGASTSDSGKLQIQFWHSMSGNTQEALDAVVAGFNESQDRMVWKLVITSTTTNPPANSSTWPAAATALTSFRSASRTSSP